MRVTVVGCSGSFPGPDSPCSCYLVEADGFCMLIDLGNGALGALQRHIGLYDIDAVLLSHLHADHCLDLCSYYVARHYRPEGPLPRIPVYGPAGTAERMARAHDSGSGMTRSRAMSRPGSRPGALTTCFDFVTLVPGTLEMGPFQVTLDRVNHPVETFAVRVAQGGSALAYSADTGRSDDLVQLASKTDLLLCEASFLEGRDRVPNLHLTGRQAGECASRAEVGRLVLTHLVPWGDPEQTQDEATMTYDGPIELAWSGATYEI